MAYVYRSSQGDELDEICFNYYGYSSGAIELVLAANRDLAKQLPNLPAGVLITLPDIPKPETKTINLWD